MCEFFTHTDFKTLFGNFYIVLIGDSNQRAVYKDLVQLYQTNSLLHSDDLRIKGELSFKGDKLLSGGVVKGLTNKTSYEEVREYNGNNRFCVRFYFITRIYNNYMESIIADLRVNPPNILLVSSCLWDITRYGPESVPQYHVNMDRLIDALRFHLPRYCLVVWNTALPISNDCRGGFLEGVEKLEYFQSKLRLMIMMANIMTSKKISSAGFDVVDLHYFMADQIHHRISDGIHWSPLAYRRITNYLLTHLSEALCIPPPTGAAHLIADFAKERGLTGQWTPTCAGSIDKPVYSSMLADLGHGKLSYHQSSAFLRARQSIKSAISRSSSTSSLASRNSLSNRSILGNSQIPNTSMTRTNSQRSFVGKSPVRFARPFVNRTPNYVSPLRRPVIQNGFQRHFSQIMRPIQHGIRKLKDVNFFKRKQR